MVTTMRTSIMPSHAFWPRFFRHFPFQRPPFDVAAKICWLDPGTNLISCTTEVMVTPSKPLRCEIHWWPPLKLLKTASPLVPAVHVGGKQGDRRQGKSPREWVMPFDTFGPGFCRHRASCRCNRSWPRRAGGAWSGATQSRQPVRRFHRKPRGLHKKTRIDERMLWRSANAEPWQSGPERACST